MTRKTLEEARTTVLQFADSQNYPILIGQVSVMLGAWSLQETEELLTGMVEDGLLRPVTKEESRRYGREHAYFRCKT